MIDLRSDTVTRPTPQMREAMSIAEVGDDMFGEDPTVNRLQELGADLFGKEAALFCSSGTQTNQIAIKVHTRMGDEVICSRDAHVYKYEGGGIAMNSGASVRLIDGERGRFKLEELQTQINPDDQHYPVSRLVCIEDTANRGGGAVWDVNEIRRISKYCAENGLALHLDGARLFNALVKTGVDYKEYASSFDSISICLSKGLGAPVGSLLLGSHEFISKAIRVRKVFGGAMRQAGILAAAGIYALEHDIPQLVLDNTRASRVGSALKKLEFVDKVLPVESNIVIFHIKKEIDTQGLLDKMALHGILAFSVGKHSIRFVFHRDVEEKMVDRLIDVLQSI